MPQILVLRFASYVIYYIKQTRDKIGLTADLFASYVIYYIKQTATPTQGSPKGLLVMLFIILSKLYIVYIFSKISLLVMLFIILSKHVSFKSCHYLVFASYVIYYIKQTQN